jgi:hypothetical protein
MSGIDGGIPQNRRFHPHTNTGCVSITPTQASDWMSSIVVVITTSLRRWTNSTIIGGTNAQETCAIFDPRLFDLLYDLTQSLGDSGREIDVIKTPMKSAVFD